MSIEIKSVDNIDKLLAFVRVMAKGTFKFDPENLDDILKALSNLAKKNNLNIVIINPSNERVAAFTCGGILAGAAIGYVVASAPGAFTGAVLGGIAGISLAHVRIRITLPPDEAADQVILEII